MYYGIHQVEYSEDDEYFDLDMLDDLAVSYTIQYILTDLKAGKARITDIDGNRIKTIVANESKQQEWQLVTEIIKILEPEDTVIAELPSDISEDHEIQKGFYKNCLNKKVKLMFLKAPQLDSDNFTVLMNDRNKTDIEAVIWKLLEVPIIYSDESAEETLSQLMHHNREEIDYTVKKRS